MKKKIIKEEIQLKKYIIRKYVMATSVIDALRKDNNTIPDDIFIDTDWKEKNEQQLISAIGFTCDEIIEEDEE